MHRGWVGGSKLATMLYKEATNDVSRVDLRTSQFGTYIVELGATRRYAAQQISDWFRKGLRKFM